MTVGEGSLLPQFLLFHYKHSKRGYTRFDFCENEQATKGLLLWGSLSQAMQVASDLVGSRRLTDEESRLPGTPHPPPSREPPKLDKLVSGNPVAVPLPPLGKAFLYILKVHLFFLTTTDLIKDN